MIVQPDGQVLSMTPAGNGSGSGRGADPSEKAGSEDGSEAGSDNEPHFLSS
jgi:hypothetical protein